MFGLFNKNPLKKMEADYAKLLEQARDLQRNGDIQGFAEKTAEADSLLQKIQAMEAKSS